MQRRTGAERRRKEQGHEDLAGRNASELAKGRVSSKGGAEQGLFVSWDGFNKSAHENTQKLFFKVRLWDDKKLISNLIECYEKLPDEIQAELPMKRIWVVVPEEE